MVTTEDRLGFVGLTREGTKVTRGTLGKRCFVCLLENLILERTNFKKSPKNKKTILGWGNGTSNIQTY